MAHAAKHPADYILPLYINGLAGRMLKLPPNKSGNREILLVYGHHAMIERWWGLAENLADFGTVTMPDMPGFGGMDSFAKIGLKPDIDAFAAYLAAFIKWRYKNKKITVYAISFGFVVVTRMLQKHPELAGRVELLVSSAGFMHYSDFLWGTRTKILYRTISRCLATRPAAFIIRYGFLNRPVINTLTKVMPRSKHRFIEVTADEFEKTVDFDVQIWQANDVRTHWLTTYEFLALDNTHRKIPLKAVHIISKYDHYFNNVKVEEHMRQVFKEYQSFMATTTAHVPHITADRKGMAIMIPTGLRRLLKPSRRGKARS